MTSEAQTRLENLADQLKAEIDRCFKEGMNGADMARIVMGRLDIPLPPPAMMNMLGNMYPGRQNAQA